jgi:hypothetical protein
MLGNHLAFHERGERIPPVPLSPSFGKVNSVHLHGIVCETEKCLMQRTIIILAALLVLGLTQAAADDASTSADNRKTEESTSLTVENLGRGLKSAAQNIEREIPKIGSAIGHAVKKITEKGPETPSSKKPAK